MVDLAPIRPAPGRPGPVRTSPRRTTFALLTGSLVFAIGQTSLFPAFPQMQKAFHTSVTGVTWTATAFQVMAAVSTGVLGRLGDMFGKRRMLLIVLCTYGLGGVVTATASSIGVAVLGRLVMGVGGAVLPLSYSVARDELPREHFAGGVGLISSTLGVGTGLGLVIGGLICDHTTFRWVFGISVVGAVISVTLVALFVPPSRARTPARVDSVGVVLLSVGLALPLIGVSRASHVGWLAGPTLVLIASGLIVLVVFGVFEMRHPQPLFHVPTFLRPQVLRTDIVMMLSGFAFYGGTFIVLVQFAQVPRSSGFGFGLSATQSGLVLVPGSIGMLVAANFASRLMASIGANRVLLFGAALSTTGISLLIVDHRRLATFATWATLVFLGLGLLSSAAPVLVLRDVPLNRSGEATGVNTIVRYVGSSLGTQVSASVLTASALTARTSYPSEHGYQVVFALLAVVGVTSMAVASRIPKPADDQLRIQSA